MKTTFEKMNLKKFASLQLDTKMQKNLFGGADGDTKTTGGSKIMTTVNQVSNGETCKNDLIHTWTADVKNCKGRIISYSGESTEWSGTYGCTPMA